MIIHPHTPEDFEKYYHLRWEVLRKPWNQPEGTEKDDMETECIHALMLNENKEAQAVCRLQFNTPEIGQIRYMAVAEAQQGKGLGKEILTFLEDIAISKDITTIVLDARKIAVPFYWECGYYITARGYLLFDSIQHFRMEKRL